MELSSPGKGQVQLIGFGCPEPEVSLEPLPIFEGQAPPPTSDCDDPVRLVGFHVNVNGEECSSPSRNTLPAKPPQSPSWAQRRDKFNRMTQDTRDWLLSHGSKRQEQQDKPEGCGGNRTNRSSGYSSSSNSSSTSSFGGGLPLAKAIETVFQLPLPPAGSFDGFRGLGVATRTYVSRSTKSTLEYVTDGATYRFSTERVSRSYHEAYDAVSESDDDEEEEEEDEDLGACSDNGRLSATPLREPSECGSTSDAELSCRLSPSRVVSICRRSEVVTQDDEDHGEEQRKNQLMKVANEVVATERAYVGVLHLIDQVFQFRVDNENRAHSMFPAEVVTHMFANVKSIYKFHHDFLLPQLEQRLNVWDKDPRLGDIMKNFAPFLKMYTEYVGNFDNAMNVINMWTAKSSRFASIVEEIQKMPECRNLSLQHHMLGPVQRIPRYQLLLKDYLKKLAPDSPDRLDSEKALQLVASAAHRANDALKKIDKFKQLLEVQESLGGTVDLVSPTRELVKEGRIVKISARSGDHQERYLFLFNDLLLLCSPRMIMANRVVAGPALWRVRAKLNVQGLEVVEGDNLETANTFYVFNGQKSIELYTSTPEEEKSWTDALQRTILDLGRRKGSLKVVGDANKIRDADLGRRPPPEVRLQGIASCARCGLQFGAFRRRHQCRACGEAVCNKCSAQKAALPYADNKPCRVCRDCHAQLSAEERDAADDAEKENHGGATTRSPVRRKGVLEVQATDHSAMCGYLHLRTQGRGRTWIQRWFALHFDCVLYSFKTHEDSRALTSTPLPGLTVSSSDRASETCERDCCFKLGHKKKTYWFQAKEADEARRWVAILDKASRAEPLT